MNELEELDVAKEKELDESRSRRGGCRSKWGVGVVYDFLVCSVVVVF